MLFELPVNQFNNIRPLLGSLDHFLVLFTLINGKTRGRVWVNQIDNPTTALVWDQFNTLFFILGDSTSPELNLALHKLIVEDIFPQITKLQYRRFFLQFEPNDAWENEKEGILNGLDWSQKAIYAYASTQNQAEHSPEPMPPLPDDYQLVPITKDLFEKKSLKNLEMITGAIKASWQSLDAYCEQGGIGYCLIHENDIASWCSTDYVVRNECDLYIETYDDYKLQGLGTLVAAACIQKCIETGYLVHWHCFHYATGSYKIAEKNQLIRTGEHPVYVVDLVE